MDIKKIVNDFLQENQYDIEIIEIFETGSKFLGYEMPLDVDVVIIGKNVVDFFLMGQMRFKKEIDDITYDLVFIDEKLAKKRLNFEFIMPYEKNQILYNYFYSFRKKIYGDSKLNFDFFNEKNRYMPFMKDLFQETIGKANDKWKIGKSFVHYYLILKFYENESFDIDNKMKEDIAKLYSGLEDCSDIILWIEQNIL